MISIRIKSQAAGLTSTRVKDPSILPLASPILLKLFDNTLFEPTSNGVDLTEHQLTLGQPFEIWIG